MSQNAYNLEVTLTGHTGTVTALQFSPDCKFLASGSDHGSLLIFCTSSWRPLKRLIDASAITTILWHDVERYLLLCGSESGDLHFITLTESLEIVTDSTSYFDGPIRSLSLLPTTPTLAVGYGENISIAEINSKPYRLGDAGIVLPKLPPHAFPDEPMDEVAMSLYFPKKNQLVVTYLDRGVVSWDLTAMSVTRIIPASGGSIGRSIFCGDCDTIASSNLLDGIDWYSLSSSKLTNSSKLPISKALSASSLACIDGGNAIIIGGLSGRAHIVSCQTFGVQEELQHRDRRDIESVAFSCTSDRRKLIAAGTAASMGAAPINIWVSKSSGRSPIMAFMAARIIDLAGFTWSNVLVYPVLFILCCAWVAHFFGVN